MFRFTPTALIGLVLCALACLAVAKDWRRGVLLLFLWLPFEDYVRKFAGNDLTIFLIKDILLAATYASALLSRHEAAAIFGFRSHFLLPLSLWAGWAFIEVFNPLGAGVAMGLVGLRMSFFYVPLFFLGVRMFRSERELQRFATAYLVAVLVVCAGGAAQLVLGAEFLNPKSYSEQLSQEFMGRRTAEYGGFLYLTSFFNNAARYARFMTSCLAISVGLFGYARARKLPGLERLAGAAAFALSVGLLLNGSRTIFLCLLVFMVGYALLEARGRGAGIGRNLSAALGTLAAATIILWIASPDTARAVFGFYYVTLSPTSNEFEIGGRLSHYGGTILGFAIEQAGWTGHGTGTESLGLQNATDPLDPTTPIQTEGGFAGITWEHGLVGLVLVLWWMGAMLHAQFRESKALAGTRWRSLGTAIPLWSALFLGPLTFMGLQVFQDFVPSSMFWFWSGVLFGLSRIPEPAAAPAAAEATPAIAAAAAR